MSRETTAKMASALGMALIELGKLGYDAKIKCAFAYPSGSVTFEMDLPTFEEVIAHRGLDVTEHEVGTLRWVSAQDGGVHFMADLPKRSEEGR